MVEPLASVVYNTLLSGRSKLNSIVRTVSATSSGSTVARLSFTPEPRRVKGKNKLENVLPEAPLDHSLQEWLSSSSRHLFSWPFRTHPMMMKELSEGENGVSTKKRPKRPPKPRHRISRYLLTLPNSTFQRRHASHASESASDSGRQNPVNVSEISPHEVQLQRFQRVVQLPPSELDLHRAWNTYQATVKYDLPLPSKLSFLDKYVSAAELLYRSEESKELSALGANAISVLESIKAIVIPRTRFDRWRLCLLARALALRGEFEPATKAIREASEFSLPSALETGIVYAYDMVLTSMMRYEGAIPAMDFIGSQWDHISDFIDLRKNHPAFGVLKRWTDSLRATAYRVGTAVMQPLSYLEREDWDMKRRKAIGCFLIEALADAGLGTEGREVFLRMQQLHLWVRRPVLFALIRSLGRRTATLSAALSLYQSAYHEGNDVRYDRLGLALYARQGNVAAFEKCFNNLKDAVTPGDISSLIHGYAMANDAKRAEETFERYFPSDEDGKRINSPRVAHFAAVINAHAREGGEESRKAISFWLRELAKADMVPDHYVFTIVLNAFAAAGDFESTIAVLEQMRDAGVKPNAVTYTIVITLLAHRQDPMGAEAVFKRALKEGIVPDNRMIVSVMNAHVEGGSWQGVIRAYDYLIAARVTALSLEVYNTLMKAYVLIGAPFNIVYKFFKRLEESKAKPDAYTYSLLVQSACDAGLLDIAADIYYEMDERHRNTPDRNLNANVYILTIIMAGFLQHGDKVRAQAVYREMLDLGIDPSPITFGTILKAYANERSKESLEIAEQFIKTLIAVPEKERTWKKPKYDSLSALHHLYSPVMRGWVQMNSPEDVERVFQDLQNAGATPSLGNLTALMDVYRRTFNIDAVREIWPDIQEYGLKSTSKDWMTPEDGPSPVTRGIRGNVLCVPLSIYIDALSAAGEHLEIAAVWKDMRTRGFSFDSHNWNHLSVAMVRAGQVERAFEVIERVIIPYQELSIHSRKTRDRNPTSPLLSDVITERAEDEEEDEAPSVPAVRSMNRHIAAMVSKSRTRDMEDFQDDIDHSDDNDHEDDFAYHLHILHQISPSWATWRAHRATLTVLLIAFNRLHQGRLVHPTGTADEYHDDDSLRAREMLNRIYDKYPKTVQLVLEHDEREKQMLSTDEYTERYNWS